MSAPAVVVAGPPPIKKQVVPEIFNQQPVVYDPNENPNWVTAIFLGFQHYLTMVGTSVLIPLLIIRAIGGEAGDLARTVQSVLFVSAINTLVQTYFGTRLPVVMGNSFYFLPIVLSIVNRGIIDIPDPHERFLRGMRATQGAFIAGSFLNIIFGFSGLWAAIMKCISPIVIAPITILVGLGLFEEAFLGYLRHHEIRKPHPYIFELYPVILAVVIVWSYAAILTAAGAYDHASELTQMNCRTDRSGLVSAAPWVRIPYPFQWGRPTFDAGDVFSVMAAAFATLIESTGGFYTVSRLAGAVPPPPKVISRSIGWQGIGLLFNGFWGTFTGTTVAPENVGLVGLNRVGSRRTVQIAAVFMLFFSIFGKFGAVVASIPQPIVAAILFVTFGMVGTTGISMLQFANMNLKRNVFVVGFSLFMGLTVPQYFREFATRAGHGLVHTNARWFNDISNAFLSAPLILAFIVAAVLDINVTRDVSKADRGMLWKSNEDYSSDPRNFQFYRLPSMSLKTCFPRAT
ncbi:hypothetical protein M758_2G077200 [Ceratodon purpureus]|nr:hypothetical protein M758_2G077200 [Ceratodon purpureus]